MKFETGKTYFGFTLVETYPVDEIQSTARVFHHNKSGAKLLHLENDDENKVFSIGFRTPPYDSTGLPHIIEHSVLSGSRKYRTKEPFMDMVKSSLQTFINAMTFGDKTIYPVASRNEKDFFNLMDVYLDAVLYPRIYDVPEIFMQEGWHHELHNKDEKLTYKGVVYNEMRGAYSSPERLLEQEIKQSLYPDTCYQYSSGGDPKVIPDLTYESFLDFHRRYYHPSNSYIYLYGNGDIEKQLDFIDKNYLGNFEKTEIDSVIHPQSTFKAMYEVEADYPIAKDETDTNRTYLSLNFILGETSDPEAYLTEAVLKQYLIESSAAPLKKALIEAGIGEDILHFNTGGLQIDFCVAAKNTSEDKKEAFKEVVFKTLTKLVKEGMDKELIEACINIAEYDLREASKFPTKGIIYHIKSLDSWLYDSGATTHLQYEETLRRLRSQIDEGYFETFIEETMLKNNHSSLVIMKPKKGLGEKQDKILEDKLARYKASLTSEEIETLIEKNKKLTGRQLAPDSQEDKATMPQLSVSDITPVAEVIPQEIFQEQSATLLFHDIYTSKIAYVDFIFDVGMIDEKLIPYINLLKEIIGKVDTEIRSYSELTKEIYGHTGGIDMATKVYVENGNDKIYYPKFIVKGKAIGDQVIPLMKLIRELITVSKLEDKKRLKELIQQVKSRLEMTIFNQGHFVASKRVASYFSPSAQYRESLNGLDFYWFVSELNENFDHRSEEIISNLEKVYKTIFNINNLIVSFTGEQDDFKQIRKNLYLVTSDLNKDHFEQKTYSFVEEKRNEGILSAANVQYVSKGYNFKKFGHKYHGTMRVLATLLNGDYLHDRIRARGGAYGCGIKFDKSGNTTTFSYRDPNLEETLKVYNDVAAYIKDLDLSKDELTRYIIGTIGRLDPALTPHKKGETAVANYICHISQADIQKEREEVINTKLNDIKALAPLLEDVMKENYCCVLGNESKIKENQVLFNNLVPLKK